MGEITELLNRARGGDRAAYDEVFATLYEELRRLARLRLRAGGKGNMLDTTGLVNDCYLRFSAQARVPPADRGHFIAYCAHVMRSVVVDRVRSSKRERHGGLVQHVTLDDDLEIPLAEVDDAEEILAVHAALTELAALEPRLAQVVEMRYFGGLTEAEIGVALGLTDRTVRRDWQKARLFLARWLKTGN